MRKTLMIAALLMTASAASHAAPAAPFAVDLQFNSPLYTAPVTVNGSATDSVEGYRTTGSTKIGIDCGSQVEADVVARVVPNLLNGGQTAFLTAVFSAKVTGKANQCQSEGLAELPSMDMEVEIAPGEQRLKVIHPDHPQLVYKIVVNYKPAG